MKKRFLCLSLLAALLMLAACGHQDRHPEWGDELTRFGDLLAAETPEGFTLEEYNDALSVNGIWYAAWSCGEAYTVPAAEGEEATAYEAQIYLILREFRSEDDAKTNVSSWIEREGQHYEAGELQSLTAQGQAFQVLPLLSAGPDNPYSHCAAAFAVRGDLAFSVEVLCVEGFDGDAQEILALFLNSIHYGE